MTNNLEVSKLAMLFDPTTEGMVIPAVRDAADAAGWIIRHVDDEGYAKEDLDKTFEALIAVPVDFSFSSYTGEELIRQSHLLEIPCAAITNSPVVRLLEGDILISRMIKAEDVSLKLTRWLAGLNAEQTPS